MQASRSLFVSAIRVGTSSSSNSTGVSTAKAIPFANTWSSTRPPSPQRQFTTNATMSSATTFFDFAPLDARSKPFPLSDHRGKVILVVNTASKCGFTPQYAGLDAIFKKFQASHPDQFMVLGFPCNQFGAQEPGSNEDIGEFCQLNYGVNFPIMGKSDVNGDNENEVYKWLKEQKAGLMGLRRIKWNFEKFLVGRDGKVAGRWASVTKPESLDSAILKELEKPPPTAKETKTEAEPVQAEPAKAEL